MLHPSFDKIAGPLTPMLKTSLSIGSSENFPTAVAVGDNEVKSGGGGGRADETIDKLAESKNIKKSAKAKRSEQPAFLSSKASSTSTLVGSWL